MVCCGKRAKKLEKKLHKVRSVKPDDNLQYMMNNVVLCGGCKQSFHIGSDELKIHCNHCEQFFHCKVAGECQGEDCKIIDSSGYTHKARYCYSCVSQLYKNGTCLCIDCGDKKNRL